MGYYSKLSSAIYNDIISGLRGAHSTTSLSLEQLEDEISEERLTILKEYALKGILPKKDLLMSINCITTDCKYIENCQCSSEIGTPTIHFEIPQILTEYGGGIEYIGSTNKQNSFSWYTSPITATYHKYKRFGKNKPYVYIDITPNRNNLYDCFVFNAPMLQKVTVIGVFKDMRQLEEYGCCLEDVNNMTFIDTEIKKRLIEKKIRYYRQFEAQVLPNTQVPE